MEQQPPRGPEDGEPFPSFDADYARQQTRSNPQGGRPVTPRPRAGRPTPQASPWIVGLAVAAVSVTVSIIAFGLFASAGRDGAAVPQTTAPDTDTTLPDDGAATTLPDGGTALPGDGSAPPIVAIGDPIPASQLTMKADGIGPFDFGADGGQVLGRFAASFGPPTDDTGFIVGSGSWGECPGDGIRVVRWGPLNLVVSGEATSSTFVSYRMDLRYGGVTSDVTDMPTLSGLRVGDTVETLQTIYGDFDIVYRVHPTLGTTFELRASAQGDILLWGPVESQSATSLVTGIYSPDSCGSG